MKRLLLALIGALLLGSPSRIWAQAHEKNNPYWIYFPSYVAGTTECMPGGGVRTVIDMDVLEDTIQFEATYRHEKIHQAQLKKDRSLCQETLTWPKLLTMETEAYCGADAEVGLRLHTSGAFLYVTILEILQRQFRGNISPDVVTRAWFDRCGAKLGITQADGTVAK